MNVSQLAVYQVPSEVSKMRKRNTVPFYDRRRALKQIDSDTAEIDHLDDTNNASVLDRRMRKTNSNCSSQSTVTTSVFLTDCGRTTLSSASTAFPNSTNVGSPLPCLPTSDVQSTSLEASGTPNDSLLSSSCTCGSPTITTKAIERHPEATLKPTSMRTSISDDEKSGARKRAAAWDRVAYYTSAAPAQATGFSFLANLGDPEESGTFD